MQAKISDSPSGALDFVKAADVVLGAWAKVRVQTSAVLELATGTWPMVGLDKSHKSRRNLQVPSV